jgi:hypothetical protein
MSSHGSTYDPLAIRAELDHPAEFFGVNPDFFAGTTVESCLKEPAI